MPNYIKNNLKMNAPPERVQKILSQIKSDTDSQQLIDFKKVKFKAYERKEITFEITEEKLKSWNSENKLVSESGKFEISTGYADHLLHTKSFILTD